MKKSNFTTAIGIFIIATILISVSCQKPEALKPANPLVGTWKTIGVDSTGNEIELLKDQVGYTTMLENGTFFRLHFNKDFPKTGESPATLEDYQKIEANSWALIGTYTVDIEKKTIAGKYLFSSNPAAIGQGFNLFFKVEGDTATNWWAGGNQFFKYVRVK